MQLHQAMVLFALALSHSVVASSVSKRCITKTARTNGPTRTTFIGTQTQTNTKKVIKLVTSVSVSTPRAKTSTSYTADISTATVQAAIATDTFTTTTTSFDITSTIVQEIAPTVTPTSTVFVLSIPPLTTTHVTSYTAEAPAPTLASAPPPPRRGLGLAEPAVAKEQLFKRQRASFVTVNGLVVPKSAVDPPPSGNATSLQKRGGKKKDVFCSAIVTRTKTITATRTATSVSKAPRQTITVVSAVPATVTTTVVPKNDFTIVTVATSVVITAPPVTQTATPTAATVTTTSTIVAQPTVTIVENYYSICDPSLQYGINGYTSYDYYSIQSYYEGQFDDASSCCQAVAATPGAVSFYWYPQYRNCYGFELNDPARCVAGDPATQFVTYPGTSQIGGTLQCGSRIV